MLVDNGRISMQETFKTLGLTEKDIEEAKALHKKAIEIDKRLMGGDIDKENELVKDINSLPCYPIILKQSRFPNRL